MPVSQTQPSQLNLSDAQQTANSNSLLTWWVRVTSPDPKSARGKRNSQWREEVTSLLFPLILATVLLPMPAAFHNPRQLMILLVVFFIDVIALFLKRAGFMTTAGLILLITVEGGLITSIVSLGAGFDSINLPLYDSMIEASLVAMAFFPPFAVFLILLVNCGFLFFSLTALPHAADLRQHLAANFVSVITTPISLQIVIAVLAFIIITALIKAIRRADKAEEIAELESQVIEQQRKDIALKEQLDFGMAEILSTLNDAAKGNFAVRAPLKKDNALWRIGYSINNLLARLQGSRDERAELEKTRQVAAQLVTSLKTGQRLRTEGWTGTCLDPVIVELMRYQASPAQPIQASPVQPLQASPVQPAQMPPVRPQPQRPPAPKPALKPTHFNTLQKG